MRFMKGATKGPDIFIKFVEGLRILKVPAPRIL